MRDATKVVQALELMPYLSILSLHTLAPSLEATLQVCPSEFEASTLVPLTVASTRKWPSLLGTVASTAGNDLVGAVPFSSRAAQRQTHSREHRQMQLSLH